MNENPRRFLIFVAFCFCVVFAAKACDLRGHLCVCPLLTIRSGFIYKTTALPWDVEEER